MPTPYTNDSPIASTDDNANLSTNPKDAPEIGSNISKDVDVTSITESDSLTTQSLSLNKTLEAESKQAPLRRVDVLDHFLNKSFASSDDTSIVGLLAFKEGLDFACMIARLMNWKYKDELLSLLNLDY